MRYQPVLIFFLLICSVMRPQSPQPAPADSIKKDTARVNSVDNARDSSNIKNVVSQPVSKPGDTIKVMGAQKPAVTSTQAPEHITYSEPYQTMSFGVGLGIDYGGIVGINFCYYTSKYIGLFGALGYALVGAGFNAGIKARVYPKTSSWRFCPMAEVMYGYNTVFVVKNSDNLSRIFYGVSLGFGFENIRNDRGGISMALIVPFRGTDVTDYESLLVQRYHVAITKELSPVAISIGYRFYFR